MRNRSRAASATRRLGFHRDSSAAISMTPHRRCLVLAVICLTACIVPPCLAREIDVPNPQASIQAAIDAAQPGDVVLVAAGTYREHVKLKEHVTLRSRGDDMRGKLGLKRAEVTILDGGGQSDTAGVTMAENSVIDGFTVTNVGRFDEAEWQKHHATQGNDQPHEHIGAPGIAGISITGVTCVVANNIVHHIGYTGIGITGVSGKRCSPTVLRNVCFRNMGGGIGSMRGSTAVIDSNVCFQNFYAGIGHEAADPLVINNECYENIRAGIGVSEGARPIVRANRCFKNRRAGIGIRTGAETSPIIEFNECFENDMAGIGCEEEATPIIRGNRCHHNRMAGIGCQEHAVPVISKNESEANDLVGIGVREKSKALLHANVVTGNKLAGIGIESESTATLLDNTLKDNGLVALGVRNGSEVLLANNQLQRKSGMPPLIAIKEGSTATLLSNKLSGGGVTSILVDGTLTAIDNDIAGEGTEKGGPPGSAVWAQKGSQVWLSQNRIDGCRVGLQADGARHVTAIENAITRFVRTALSVKNTTGDVRVSGNRAVSSDPKAVVLEHDVRGQLDPSNRLEAP